MKKILLTIIILTTVINIFGGKKETQDEKLLEQIKNATFSETFEDEYEQITSFLETRLKIAQGYAGMDFYINRISLRETDYPLLIEGSIYSGEYVMDKGTGFLYLSSNDPGIGPGVPKALALSNKDLQKTEKLKKYYLDIMEKMAENTKERNVRQKLLRLIQKHRRTTRNVETFKKKLMKARNKKKIIAPDIEIKFQK